MLDRRQSYRSPDRRADNKTVADRANKSLMKQNIRYMISRKLVQVIVIGPPFPPATWTVIGEFAFGSASRLCKRCSDFLIHRCCDFVLSICRRDGLRGFDIQHK